MQTVSTEDYPSPLPWSERADSIQYVPKGAGNMANSLLMILREIRDGVDQTKRVNVSGINSKSTYKAVCQRLKPLGLFERVGESWMLTKYGHLYADTADNAFLAAVICHRVKFAAELLALESEPITEVELLAEATTKYHLSWKTVNQVHARNDWFCALGLVLHYAQTHQYVLTDEGREFIETVRVLGPEDILEPRAEELSLAEDASPWSREMCESLTDDELKQRKVAIQRIPGSGDGIVDTISAAITFLTNPRSLAEFDAFTEASLGLDEDGSQGYRSALRTLDLLRDVPDGIQATDEALLWNERPNAVDLAFFIHAKRRYVFEMLMRLDEGPATRDELRAHARVLYGLDLKQRISLDLRVTVLRNAGMISGSKGSKVVAITDFGREILGSVVLERPERNDSPERKERDEEVGLPACDSVDDLLQELFLASRDSENYERFESACANAFRFLGFEATKIGVPHDTDVLVSARNSKRYAYSFIVDAKSSKHAQVSSIKYDPILSHQAAHGANYAVVVAPGFPKGDVITFALERKVLLMTVDDLSKVLRAHDEVPLGANDYESLLRQTGLADLEALEAARRRKKYDGKLLHVVLDWLMRNSTTTDKVRWISASNIALLMLNDPSPSLPLEGISEDELEEDVKNALELLSSPLIGCVHRDERGSGYHSVGSHYELAAILSYLADACG